MTILKVKANIWLCFVTVITAVTFVIPLNSAIASTRTSVVGHHSRMPDSYPADEGRPAKFLAALSDSAENKTFV